MIFFDIFAGIDRFILTTVLFIAFFYSAWNARQLKIGRGAMFLVMAVGCIVMTSVLQNFSSLSHGRFVSERVLTFTEMIFVIAGSVLLIVSASLNLFNKKPDMPVIFLFVSIALTLAIYAVFIMNDIGVLVHIRQLLPIVGMACVFLSFSFQPRFFRHIEYMLAALASAGFIFLMIWPMTCPYIYPWWAPLICIAGLMAAYIVGYITNLQESLVQAMAKQERTAQNINQIVRSSPFPIIISRLSDDALILANRNAVKLFGINENELSRYRFKDFFVDSENRHLLLERLEKKQEIQDFEILVKSASGSAPFWLLASANAMDYNNDVVLYTAFQDITDRKRREDILRTQADRDPLTSIYNRRFFEDNAAQKILKSRRNKQPFALMMIDADHFKRINDTYGHKIGDKVLIELAAVCERTLRTDDLVSRYGGEEFIIYIENVTPDIAMLVANRLHEAINASVVYAEGNEPVRFTVSIGVVPSGISDNIDMMIKMADDAMYLAKKNGRNRVEMYDEQKIEQAKNSQNWKMEQKSDLHPIYLNEDDNEISLLDGIESKHMIGD